MNKMINFLKTSEATMETFNVFLVENSIIRLAPKIKGIKTEFLIKKDTRINVATNWLITHDKTPEWTALYEEAEVLLYIGHNL